jgi:hypothetical protein
MDDESTEQPEAELADEAQGKSAGVAEAVGKIVSAINWRELVETRPAIAVLAAFSTGLLLSFVAIPLLRKRTR